MSGIATIFEHGGTVPRSEFDAVFDALDHRGWDGADAATVGRVALGHQHAYTTPEAVGERQPIERDGLWIVIDGRLDNRPELFDRLASAGEDPSVGASDAELVLRAYRALGDSFLDALVGAFALAIWDPSDDRLLLARDKTGIRKLYYADTGNAVVAASEMQAVLEHPGVSTALNEALVGEYLVGDGLAPDETFYEAVQPVQPGSFVEVTADGTRAESYWEVWDARVDVDESTDVVEEFLDRLEAAVACRLRSPTLPGVMMSGGLDSTTVASIASRHLDETGDVDDELHTFSLILDDIDEFEAEADRIDAVVERWDLRSHTLRADDHFPLKEVDVYQEQARESPVFSPLVLPSRELYEAASEAGRDVLLAGYAGNMYDGNRFYYLDLLRELRPATFVRHARADPMPLRTLLLWFVLVPASDRLASLALRWYGDDRGALPPWIDPGFAERSGLSDRLAEESETGFDSASRELAYKRHYRTERRFEEVTDRRLAIEAGVDVRSPLLDSRLVAFVYSLPTSALFEAGREKVLFRRAMEGILPEEVRTQSAHVHFDPMVDRGIREERRTFVEELFADSRLAERGIVDGEALEARVRNYLEEGEDGARPFWSVLSTELWLNQRG